MNKVQEGQKKVEQSSGPAKKVEQSLGEEKKLKTENWTKFFVVICRIYRIYVGYVGYEMKQKN